MSELNFQPVYGRAPGDQYGQALDEQLANEAAVVPPDNPLDDEASQATLRQLLSWYYLEKERQALNRLEMAMDADFYDNLQWSPDDAQILKDRGQMPLVFNEVAPMVDWLIGTQRRTAVDWRVLPRSEDDVDARLSQRRRLLNGSLHVQKRSWQLGLDV
jgi:hypothetical protein